MILIYLLLFLFIDIKLKLIPDVVFQMNTVISIIGPWCSGKSSLSEFIQRKYAVERKIEGMEMVFPEENKAVRREVVTRRNEALDDQSKMFEFLKFLVEKAAREALEQFQKLEARQFLFTEQSIEYLDLMILAAKNIKLITQGQWKQLRTLVDNSVLAFITDIFILFSVEEYELCGNFHRKSGKSDHRMGSTLQRWNEEVGKLHSVWSRQQKAKGKLIINVNSRISRFARSLKSKQIVNVVLHFSNVHHGTSFQLFGAAANIRNADERREDDEMAEVENLAIKKLVATKVIEMPPKKPSTSKPSAASRSGTEMPGMDAQGLHDQTTQYQRQLQRFIQIQQRGPPPHSSSAGLVRPQPRLGPGMARPRMMGAGVRNWAPRGVGRGELQPMMRPSLRPRMGRGGVPGGQMGRDRTQIEDERARLMRRLAELDEEQRRERRQLEDLSRGEERYPLYPPGYRSRAGREEFMREEGTRFTRADQEKMSDLSMKKKMEQATSRMLSSTYGGGMVESRFMMSGSGGLTQDVSENEEVSEDNTDDSSDTEERKRKIRQKNKKKDAKRRKSESQSLRTDTRMLDYNPLEYYQGESQYSGQTYESYEPETEEMYWPRENYYDPEPSQGWSGHDQESYNQDWGDEEDFPYTQENPSQFGGGAEYEEGDQSYDQMEEKMKGGDTEVDESAQGSEISYESKDAFDPEMTLHDDEFQEEEELRKKKEEESKSGRTSKERKGKALSTSGKGGKSSKTSQKEKKEESELMQVEKGKGVEEIDIFQPPEAPLKRIPKKKITKVTPKGGVSEEGKKKGFITAEEMETALSNLKKEEITPPRMTDTTRSDDLKKWLVAHVDDEISMEMNVGADKVRFLEIKRIVTGNTLHFSIFPKLLNSPLVH